MKTQKDHPETAQCHPPLSTGQHTCHNASGSIIPCTGTGQDGDVSPGIPWPEPRFSLRGEITQDNLTGLLWTTNAIPTEFPLPWDECFDFLETMNHENVGGRDDWRMPGRRELYSLISFAHRKPALPVHSFSSVFLGWYWTSTTYAGQQDHAWRVHTEGGRMFFGRKSEYSLLWPVAGNSPVLPASGQTIHHDPAHRDVQHGIPLPQPRFTRDKHTVFDRLTGLKWWTQADLCGPVSWSQSLEAVQDFNANHGNEGWRLPTIRELESLIDCSYAFPALEPAHPFTHLGDTYWSSTSSSFEYDWAMALYLNKGAVGVGYKTGDPFLVWPVCSMG